ncbi:hypothetical protein RFI_13129 [Reticulomyxa filosa]|uniref:Uncharacterized protein n=1 Tax=Reticulomyxa filosa TaxID=46433 RepID=X6NE65_RETFI|nr:hypothetical protein RFI_13129 [Reticulomyxa filosa]|eukprot:ETO24034.1 hypothetical protein RFI_13129 [Reticulomyxa filosa]
MFYYYHFYGMLFCIKIKIKIKRLSEVEVINLHHERRVMDLPEKMYDEIMGISDIRIYQVVEYINVLIAMKLVVYTGLDLADEAALKNFIKDQSQLWQSKKINKQSLKFSSAQDEDKKKGETKDIPLTAIHLNEQIIMDGKFHYFFGTQNVNIFWKKFKRKIEDLILRFSLRFPNKRSVFCGVLSEDNGSNDNDNKGKF